VGAGDLSEFRSAGRTLFSLGLVKGSEGNLSVWDGKRLVITRTGCALADLGEGDVLQGTIDEPPERASSDLPLHVSMYRGLGPGAIAHAHPPGSVPPGWVEGQPHGAYAHESTLEAAVDRLVRRAREGR
jgi:ribulose-5-phosphate 4-epimerase/fuculose-1-phosphate aldolase